MVKIKKYKGQNKEGFSLENPEIISETVSKSEVFINKNKNILFGILSFLVVSFLLFSFFNYFKTNQNSIAQEEMFQAIYYFESDIFSKNECSCNIANKLYDSMKCNNHKSLRYDNSHNS